MCTKLFLYSNESSKKQRAFEKETISKRGKDNVHFLSGKDAVCVQKIRKVIKKKKPDLVVLVMSNQQRATVKNMIAKMGTVKHLDENTLSLEKIAI